MVRLGGTGKALVVLLMACAPAAAFNKVRPSSTRRAAILKSAAAAAAVTTGSLWRLEPCIAYDSIPSGAPSAKAPPPRQLDWNDLRDGNAVGKYGKPPPQEFKDPEKLQAERMKAKAEREKKAAKKNAEADSLIADITKASEAKDPVAFADATDKLSLWIIEQGPPLPPPGGPWADSAWAVLDSKGLAHLPCGLDPFFSVGRARSKLRCAHTLDSPLPSQSCSRRRCQRASRRASSSSFARKPWRLCHASATNARRRATITGSASTPVRWPKLRSLRCSESSRSEHRCSTIHRMAR